MKPPQGHCFGDGSGGVDRFFIRANTLKDNIVGGWGDYGDVFPEIINLIILAVDISCATCIS